MPGDLQGGRHSLPEQDFLRALRRAGLPCRPANVSYGAATAATSSTATSTSGWSPWRSTAPTTWTSGRRSRTTSDAPGWPSAVVWWSTSASWTVRHDSDLAVLLTADALLARGWRPTQRLRATLEAMAVRAPAFSWTSSAASRAPTAGDPHDDRADSPPARRCGSREARGESVGTATVTSTGRWSLARSTPGADTTSYDRTTSPSVPNTPSMRRSGAVAGNVGPLSGPRSRIPPSANACQAAWPGRSLTSPAASACAPPRAARTCSTRIVCSSRCAASSGRCTDSTVSRAPPFDTTAAATPRAGQSSWRDRQPRWLP